MGKKRNLSAEIGEIARGIELRGVHLGRTHAEVALPRFQLPVNARIEVGTRLVPRDAKAKTVIVVEAIATVRVDSKEEVPQSLYSIECTFMLVYQHERAAELPDDALLGFVESNGMIHAVPYIREYVQSTSQRMGFRPLVLPVFRVGRGVGGRDEAAMRAAEKA